MPLGLDLNFLEVLEHGVLARLPIDQAVGGDAVDGEGFSEPLAPFTWKPPSISPWLTDGAVDGD